MVNLKENSYPKLLSGKIGSQGDDLDINNLISLSSFPPSLKRILTKDALEIGIGDATPFSGELEVSISIN